MILMSPALEIAAPILNAAPGSRPAPTGADRPGRTEASSGPSFRDELRAAETGQRENAAAGTGPSAGGAEKPDTSSAAAPAESCAPAAQEDACPGDNGRSSAEELVAAVLKACGVAADLPAEDASASAGEPAAAEEGQAEASAELLELFEDIRTLGGAVGSDGAAGAEIARLVEGLSALADANPRAALPGQIHQMLRDLREHLAGIAWGRAVKDAEAVAPMPAPEPTQAESADIGSFAEIAALSVTAAGEEGEPIGARATIQAETHKAAAAWKTAADRRATPLEAAPISGSETETVEPSPFAPAAPVRPAGQRPEGQESPELRGQLRQDTGRAPETGREPTSAEPRPEMKAASVEELPAADAAESASAEPAPADSRLFRLHDGRPERVLEANAAVKDKEAAGASRAGVFDQIVQRAVLQVRNEQSEIKIDLKPEFLGNVRMQIVSENQQVSVRILTEAPAVRDMIETGLQQLRSELQSQGLKVDRLEVAVSDHYREPRQRQEKAGDRSASTARSGAVDATERSAAGDRVETAYFRKPPSARRSTVDMFV
ncbi:MAG TPA: flagellar hook-length control protein FliK [Desulfobacterales bacterium]|nr:flagellar hook-length control protein FliK [Desulfobacterales bacterium]